jgi:hypothetical protein
LNIKKQRNDIPVYFIRHKFGVRNKLDNGEYAQDISKTKEVMREAWESNVAVIDYIEVKDLNNAFNPDAPEYVNDLSAKKTIRKINNFFQNGGGLVAIFSALTHPNKLRVGFVKKLSGGLHCFESYPSYSFKVINYEFVAEIEIDTCSSLFAKIPRQTTFTHWPSAKKTLNQIYKGEALKIDEPSDLDPSQLEILCYEWMKDKGLIDRLTMPIGRTMRFVDIVGVDKELKNVYAQVTFHNKDSKEFTNKLNVLKDNFRGNLHFFCNGKSEVNEGINITSIDEVFNWFYLDKNRKAYLERLVGRIN